jgi:peptidoglycan hydrolase-like protein with peptidoglycan-binding domain
MNDSRKVFTRRCWLVSVTATAALMSATSHSHDTDWARVTGAQVYASPAQVRLVQDRLQAEGRKPGITGIWDAKTVSEVRDFQKANNLAPTGQLDTSLLSALHIGDLLQGETAATKTASGDFLDGLLRADAGEHSPPVEVTLETSRRGTPIYVSPLHVAQIQHLLREQNLYSGAIDGVWGERTAAAANEYRQRNSLDANAGIDIALLRALNQPRVTVPRIAANAMSRRLGVPLQAGPSSVRALQRELSQRGFEAGDIDGAWGDNTRQALRDFQRTHQLETTGTLTLPTLAALGIDIANSPQATASEH